MYYSTWISLIFIEIFKITANLKRNMGFWRNYSQLFGSTLGTFWTSFVNSENRTQIDKNPCTIVHGFHWFFIEIFKITANLKRKMGFWRNYSQLFGSTLGTFWTSFKNSENRTQIDKNPCTIVHGFHWFSVKFLKSPPIWNEKWASDETIHNFSGVPKERFGQVSKIRKIAPKLTKTHVL